MRAQPCWKKSGLPPVMNKTYPDIILREYCTHHLEQKSPNSGPRVKCGSLVNFCRSSLPANITKMFTHD